MLLILGDSVTWGQGLDPARKLDQRLPQLLAATHPGLNALSLAHSGAVIGVDATEGDPDPSREVPVADPTILAQVSFAVKDAALVSAVVLYGGIYDVNIRVIVNPFTSSGHLDGLIEQHCFHGMVKLLDTVAASFPDDGVPILVVGYYPILSHNTGPQEFPKILEAYSLTDRETFSALSNEEAAARWRGSVGNCLAFWQQSDDCLSRAVKEFNASRASTRAHFIQLPFEEKNAVFASEPWLWQVDEHIRPEDDVVSRRRDACRVSPNVSHGGPSALFTCDRASVGHPNRTGADVMARAVAATLEVLLDTHGE